MSLRPTSETLISPSLFAYAKTSARMADASVRLATGNRILRNGDDASSISAAASLQAQSATLRGSLTSGARATSFLQVASNGLSQIRDILTTLGDLADQAAGSGITPYQYAYLDAQFQAAKNGIDGIVAATMFDGQPILDGSASGSGQFNALIGDASGGGIALSLADVSSASLFPTAVAVGSNAEAVSAQTDVTTAQTTIDSAIAAVDAYQLRLSVADSSAQGDIYGITLGIDALLGADTTAETSSKNGHQLRQGIAAALFAQSRNLNSNLLHLVQ